jgi:diguanylate cyclase (GGDEF)-like protein
VFILVMLLVLLRMNKFMYKYWQSWRYRRGLRTASFAMAIITAGVLCGGWFFVNNAEKREYERTRDTLVGNAPILAYELSKLGHEKIDLNIAANDSQYVHMITTMIDWMRLNRQINSIYTLRKLENGSNVFILGPETDYNRNGYLDEDKEHRVPIGTIYEERIQELDEAFIGKLTFQSEVTEDRWGKTISAFVPIIDSNGREDAVLGLDFDGELFVKNVALSRLGIIGIVFFILLILNAAFMVRVYYFEERQFRRHQEELRYQAYHDSLTGLPNLMQFKERLLQKLTELPGQAQSAAVMFLDIDRFKNVNDSLGHNIGDQLLLRFAERLSGCLDKDDLLARPGGDEFIVLVQNVRSPGDVLRKAEAIQAVFDQPIVVKEYELYVTSSIGAHLLKKKGLSIALDDFGTGYSSLSYLRSCPLDVLKIDKEFVKDVASNQDNAAIVTAIIMLAHNLGLKVICEGVETKEQLEFLKDRKCDEIQGYYFSKPVPSEDLEKWLELALDEGDSQTANIS